MLSKALSRMVQRTKVKSVLRFNSDSMRDREKAYEKEFIHREESRKIKKLRKQLKDKSLQDEEYFYVSEDVDVEAVLEDREWLLRTFTENGINANDQLVKQLLKWKHES